MRELTVWGRLGRGIRDPYFVVGSLLAALLVLTAVLGPEVAPHNPSLVKPLQWVDGELHKAPFPPGNIYPLGTDDLGRDQLSLLLYGARTTLVMALVATVLRLLLGLFLGTCAGWWPQRLFDRGVTALTEVLASVPGLILAMLLVFAVGIRRGHVSFVAALSLVGWGEVAQVVRGHVLTIRTRLYITAARAVGLSPAGILSRHVLPNLLATLLSLASLEMARALLLLGELGFVHVFVGGGRVGFSMATWEARHYFDVPDWGAMLGTSWRWFRSYPWLPIAPALAFFVAILGFTLFGYGLQRFIERGRFHPSGLSVLRFLVVVAVVLLGARTLLKHAGVESQFARLARQFDVDRTWDDVASLTQELPEGQPAHSDGVNTVATYIADQFDQAGLSPASPDGSYFHTYTATRGRITGHPALTVLDASGKELLSVREEISFDPWQAFQAEGSIEAELTVVGNGGGRVLNGAAMLLLDPEESVRLPWSARPLDTAILRMVPDNVVGRSHEPPPFDQSSYSNARRLPAIPSLLIGESTVRQILTRAGLDLHELQATTRAGERITLPTGLRVRLTYGLVYEEVPAANVIGYIAGLDRESQGERILLTATYGGSALDARGSSLGADENASSIAVLLETARLLHDLDWVPRRTIVFVAFDHMGGSQFVVKPPLPTSRSDIWTAVILHGVGAGRSRLARLESAPGLATAFDQSARRFRIRTEKLDEWRFFFLLNASRLSWGDLEAHTSYQALTVTREGDELSGTPGDTLDRLDLEQLSKVGQTVAHFVMVLSAR
jgi:peptide/nickel transport system permease protein